MLNMRGLERQQLALLELRSAASQIDRRTVSQGVLEGESFLQAAIKEVRAQETEEITFQETNWGYRAKRKVRRA